MMCLCNKLVFIFVILCCARISNSYNIDTENVVSYQGDRSSMFGFSVAAHLDRGENMVLIGAPKAQTNQPGVANGGAVFKCSVSRGDCTRIPFDRYGDYPFKGNIIDQKSNQWFGSTLYSSGPDGPVVACASRYVYFSTKYDRRDPVGTCYVARNHFTDFSEYSPCRTWQWGYHRQGSCQAGFSAAISRDGRRLFVGAPGNCYWQGRSFSIDAHAKFPFTPPVFGPYGSGKVVRQSLESRPAVLQTKEGSAEDDDSYLGYSMAIGDFYGEGIQGVAAGMPRGGGLLGKVLLYTWNLTNFMNITGRQMGCYFGYSIASADIDGDGHDDIVIGAPLYTEPNNEGKYEVGKVYVVYQKSEQGMFRKLHELDGTNSKGRFGLSLASLGDINLDGYMDFAVGAPYDGRYERGAVYIFHGSKNGVLQKHTQVIHAEDMSGVPPSTFGFSLAGGLDLDQNDYPDTIIGAYNSDTAFFLRSKPVVKVEGYAQFQTADKEIVLETKNCKIRSEGSLTPVACVGINTCLKYTGVGVPREVSLQLQYALDTKKGKNPRMFFLEGDRPLSNVWNGTWRLSKDAQLRCDEKVVYIKNDIRDKLTPLDVVVTYTMDTSRHVYSEPAPVLDITSKSLKKDSISVHKNCGTDNVCIPNLALEVESNVKRYLLASNEDLIFDVLVSNRGEDSFETTFSVQMPEDVNYNKIQDTGDVKISCRELSYNRTITCDIGNPLPARKIANFKMSFKPRYKEGMKRFYVFNMMVNSTNPEDESTMEDNKVQIKLPIWVNSRLELKGGSRPAKVPYNWSYYSEMEQLKHEREIGPQVIHLYTITNNGPSKINEAKVLFFWPYATASGDDLMYLLEPPHVSGNVRCERADFNYQGYQIEKRNKTIWEVLNIESGHSGHSSFSSTGTSQSISKDGVFIEENKVKAGEKLENDVKVNVKNQDKYEKSTGDASYVHQERHSGKKLSEVDSSGKTTLIIPSRVSQQKTITNTYTNTSTRTGPDGKTTIITTKTTIVTGPDGKILKNETTVSENEGVSIFRGQNEGGTVRKGNYDFTLSSQHGSGVGGGSTSRKQFNTDERYSQVPYSSVEFDVSPPNVHTEHEQQSGQIHGGRYSNEFQVGSEHYQSGQQGGHYQRGQNHVSQSGGAHNRTSETDYLQSNLGGASLGHDAKVGVLELGMLDRNVDESLSRQGSSAHFDGHSEYEGTYDPDLGRIEYGTHKPRPTFKSRVYSEERSGQYNPDGSRNYQQSGRSQQGSHSESHWSSSGGQNYNLNIGSDDHDRHRRQIDEDRDLKNEVQCKATKCRYFKCFIGPMPKDGEVTIVLRTRINANTLKKISSSKAVTLSTMMVGKITNVPYIGNPSEKEIVKHEVVTSIMPPEPETKPDVVPLWAVVLSAVAGALILLLLIFLFYKCGFFKRNRPSNVPERQPLNRNGHYSSGDEAL